MRLGDYVRMSTANPTGWRPWNSRLGFYLQNSFPLPTASRGPWLLAPGVCDCVRPRVSGGLGIDFPNYPGIGARGPWLTHGGYPAPIYAPPRPVQLSGPVSARYSPLQWPGLQVHRAPITITPATPSGVAVAQSNGSTSTATGTAPPAWQRRRRNRGSSANPTQQPGYVVGSDASGNPIYAQPPLGQVVTGYDAQGNPVYGPAMSTVGTGGVVNSGYGGGLTTAGTVTGYDASGNPIYASQPAGSTVTGYDAQGNPIFGNTGSPAGTSWFSQDSLGLGLNNGVYAVGALALAWLFSSKGRR